MHFLATILSTLALGVSFAAAAPAETIPAESLAGDATFYDSAGKYGACGPQLFVSSPFSLASSAFYFMHH